MLAHNQKIGFQVRCEACKVIPAKVRTPVQGVKGFSESSAALLSIIFTVSKLLAAHTPTEPTKLIHRGNGNM